MLHYGYAEKMAQPFYLSTGRCEELHPRTSYTQCRKFGVFFVFITSIPMNWGLSLSSSLLLFGSLISFISLVLYYLGRVKRFFYPLNLWTIVNLWNACFFGFFFNGGSHGGIQYYFLLSLLTAVLISKPTQRVYVTILYLIGILLAFLLEFLYPSWIQSCPNNYQRTLDVAISFRAPLLIRLR